MKHLILLSLTFLIYQVGHTQSDKFEVKLIDTINLSKQDLYSRARAFVAYSFKNSKNVIQMDDKETGKIICKGTMTPKSKGTFGMTYQNNVDFTLTIDIKENKYRATLSDFSHTGLGSLKEHPGGAYENEKPDCGTLFIPKKDWNKMKDAIKIESELFLVELKKSISKEIKTDDF